MFIDDSICVKSFNKTSKSMNGFPTILEKQSKLIVLILLLWKKFEGKANFLWMLESSQKDESNIGLIEYFVHSVRLKVHLYWLIFMLLSRDMVEKKICIMKTKYETTK